MTTYDSHREQFAGRVLTEREMTVLRLVADGLSNRAIASELNIREQTVKNHLYSIMAKLEVENRTQAAAIYWKGTVNVIYSSRLRIVR
jgi:DNA-binding NarL/FixJ family response regulator